MNQDKSISIVISVLNSAETLEQCLLSVYEQTYPHKEVIVIDGGSNDGTVDIINSNSSWLSYWISEPDTGIYNAWNKALQRATGDWICFIGGDDRWFSPASLSELAALASYPDVNFVSGKLCIVDNQENVVRSVGREWNFRKMGSFMRVGHPCALHHRSLFERHGFFDESYKIAGDYAFLLRVGRNIRANFLQKNVVCMRNTGLSNAKPALVFNEGRRALQEAEDFGTMVSIRFYLMSNIKYFIRTMLTSVSVGQRLLRWKDKLLR